MTDVATHNKTTPARRRQGRNGPKPNGQKAYASENDVASFDPYAHRGQATPQTPNKMNSPADARTMQSSQAAKQRSQKNKPKSSHQGISPETDPRQGQTPPHRNAQPKPVGAVAFAGATFHASPAPSALAMPSFLAKKMSESPARPPMDNIAQEPSPPATDTEVPSPFRPSSVPRSNESPLDFMFRAHREERQYQRRDSPASQNSNLRDATSPPSFPPFDPHNSPRPSPMSQSRRPDVRRSASGIGSAELDGTPGRPMGPAFSTPYGERIKAARPSNSQGLQDQSPQQNGDDQSEALKKFLFGGGGASRSAGVPPSAPPHHMGPANMSQSSPSRMTQPPPPQQGHNIQAMENDLRRILKMDMGPRS